MEKKIIKNLYQFKSLKGTHLGYSNWTRVNQEKIDNFASATKDFQWIHTDVDRVKIDSPYKSTIAHGYYTLSLLPIFFSEVWECKNIALILNYGSEKIRFISPVLCNSEIRASISLLDAYDYKEGLMLKSKVDIEIKGFEKLAMSAIILSLIFDNK